MSGRRTRAAAVLALLACITAAAPATAAPRAVAPGADPAAGPVGAITAKDGWLRDAVGRTVIVHGLQLAHKTPPYHPPPASFTATDAARIAAWGFDAVRVAWFWKGLEPARGHFDDAYAQEIARESGVLAEHGVMVHLEAHQDGYNERTHGAGFPDWATNTDGLSPQPDHGSLGNVLDPAQQRAFDNLYADTGGIAGEFAKAWTVIARATAAHPPALGYDLFNEPYPGTQTATCVTPAGCPLFDRGSLEPLQDRLAAAVRAVDRHGLVWYEPNVLFDFGAANAFAPPPAAAGPAAFAFHAYCIAALGTAQPDHESASWGYPACPYGDGLVFDNAAAAANAMGGLPTLLNEFGDTQDLANIRRLTALADSRRVGWMFWGYKDWVDVPGGLGSGALFDNSDDDRTVRLAKVKALSTPYPQATAGTPVRYGFDPVGRVFDYTYTADDTVDAPTVVFTAPLHYPDGYLASAQGATIVSAPDAPKLLLRNEPGVRSVTVHIIPRLPLPALRPALRLRLRALAHGRARVTLLGVDTDRLRSATFQATGQRIVRRHAPWTAVLRRAARRSTVRVRAVLRDGRVLMLSVRLAARR